MHGPTTTRAARVPEVIIQKRKILLPVRRVLLACIKIRQELRAASRAHRENGKASLASPRVTYVSVILTRPRRKRIPAVRRAPWGGTRWARIQVRPVRSAPRVNEVARIWYARLVNRARTVATRIPRRNV